MDKGPKRTTVIGIGNLLLMDEGVGVHVVRELERKDLPPEVEVIDGGTSTMELLPIFQERERIIVIDAVKGGGEPGAVYRITPEELEAEQDRPLSLHQVGLLDVLGMARQLGPVAEVVIIGVEPKEIRWGMDLSPEVREKVPLVVEAVLEELGLRGE